jgi:Tfp pilus assembly protein PilV
MSEAKQADPAEVARMATAHASAVHLKVGPVFETAVWGWLPKLGGKVVRLKGGPENGYPTRQSAVDAAREFRGLCRAAAPVQAPVTLVPDTVAGGGSDDLLAEAEKLARRLKSAPSMFAADMEAMTDRLIARVREAEANARAASINATSSLALAERMRAGRDAAITERDALAAFKAFTHRRLDEAGIPTHPEGPHSAEGCRIGDRLDIIQQQRDVAMARASALTKALLEVAPRHQGGHSEAGAAIAEALGLPFPLRMAAITEARAALARQEAGR